MEWLLHGFLFAVGVACGILIMPTKKPKQDKYLYNLLEDKNEILRNLVDAINSK